jgi:chromosome segregation ATPase
LEFEFSAYKEQTQKTIDGLNRQNNEITNENEQVVTQVLNAEQTLSSAHISQPELAEAYEVRNQSLASELVELRSSFESEKHALHSQLEELKNDLADATARNNELDEERASLNGAEISKQDKFDVKYEQLVVEKNWLAEKLYEKEKELTEANSSKAQLVDKVNKLNEAIKAKYI